MRNLGALKRRIQRLEKSLGKGELVQYSQAWMDYWDREWYGIMVGESKEKAMPLEYARLRGDRERERRKTMTPEELDEEVIATRALIDRRDIIRGRKPRTPEEWAERDAGGIF
ncbi:MAG: hypothetical protein ABI824_11050 [Acidobacteriota bacterium]